MAEDQAPSQGTRQVRVPEDLADMLAGIIEVEGGSVADFLDPIARPAVIARFQEIEPALKTIRAARASARTATNRRAGI
ncbi:unnamed protein product [Gemmata massiliana]|uniref:Uncharacterized protein n=1 Tax=Gemmata massiliana TaxID=1210884 RepID=A0A6P2DCE3_9BACT|nr:hypothetical protein [Gemmata massiliana]VTR99166.1 unnamed protein product [Gemmata massiliana]